MKDCDDQIYRLNNWSVVDIKNHPALTVGLLRSAAAEIERLSAENDRLHRENFWLSQKTGGNEK